MHLCQDIVFLPCETIVTMFTVQSLNDEVVDVCSLVHLLREAQKEDDIYAQMISLQRNWVDHGRIAQITLSSFLSRLPLLHPFALPLSPTSPGDTPNILLTQTQRTSFKPPNARPAHTSLPLPLLANALLLQRRSNLLLQHNARFFGMRSALFLRQPRFLRHVLALRHGHLFLCEDGGFGSQGLQM